MKKKKIHHTISRFLYYYFFR